MSHFKATIYRIAWKTLKLFLPRRSVYRTYCGEFFSNKYLDKLTFREAVWTFRKGFLPREYLSFNLAHNDSSKYLSRLNNVRGATINGEYSYLLGNKLFFERHLRAVICDISGLHVIENLAYLDKGKLIALRDDLQTGNFLSIIPLLENKDLIIKPVSGARGRGVYLLQKEKDQYMFGSKSLTWNELLKEISSLDNYLIQERFVQTGFSHEIYPMSLNCMRIVTMNDGEPFIPYALHRFGSQYSGYTDNSSQGGISALIGPDGRMGRGRTLNFEGKLEIHDLHPISKKPIYNAVIPGWENITGSMIEMVRRMPYFKHIGWDVVLSDNELHILEGNIGPGVNIIQMHKPLREIEPAWDFYKRNGFF